MLLVYDFHHHHRPRRLAFTEPCQVIEAAHIDEVRPALRAAEQAAQDGYYVAGYLAYEAAPAFDAAHAVRAGCAMPLVWFGVFAQPVELPRANGPFEVGDWQASVSPANYDADIVSIRAAIARGETYQVNYTLRQRAAFGGDSFVFYEQLARSQRAPYGAYLDLGRFQILSASPELFFHRAEGRITTRPMKGTVARGRWSEEDEARAAWLHASEKNRAENVMIVDLLRNDLGRIAIPGSVKVDSLLDIERYPTVFQMTSAITAQERAGTTLEDVFAALFPCGSITGAPKISTMRLIAELEDAPRQVYCGTIGLLEPGGAATFSVAIRTVLVDRENGSAEYGVGGGIVWDSRSEDEYNELTSKMAVLTEDAPEFKLLETLRVEDGDYALLERHLKRLIASACYFSIPIDAGAIQRALADHAQTLVGPHRVRLLVSQQGEIRVESVPSPEASPDIVKVALATEPIARKNRFLYHKTTHRTLYERHRADRPDALDVLLWNEQDEITEFTIGNVVVELDGELWTPPLECGLLPGTQRAEALARGEVRERIITLSEARNATRLWLINGVRGWVRVELLP